MASISKWTVENSVRDARESQGGPQWPNEVMVKALSSSRYSTSFTSIQAGSKVLDLGCLYCNNLRFFGAKGCELYGVEVNPEMVQLARDSAARLGLRAEIRQGNNRELPFEAGAFDLLASVNTIHYEVGRENVSRGLREFARVLKPGTGRLFLMTAGPEHEIVQRSVKRGDLDYEVAGFDFRDGDHFAFFEDSVDLEAMVRNHFEQVESGRVTERYPSITLDFQFVLASGPKS